METKDISTLDHYLKSIDICTNEDKEINKEYFLSLYDKFKSDAHDFDALYEPEKEINSPVIPFAIASDEDLKEVSITKYSELADKKDVSDFSFRIIKMHAGLGSSVERLDHLIKISQRDFLGSKGTDLFIEVDGKYYSMSYLQLVQAEILKKESVLRDIIIQCLVNEETFDIVKKTNEEEYKNKKSFKIDDNIFQLKMPTIDQTGKLSTERLAPAGHAFLGFKILSDLFESKDLKKEFITIGNGEDLNSVADLKILSWMKEKKIPITMITTTKLLKDKKGGQISFVKVDKPFVTIIEKAQAEKSNQLEYFEELGLRENDKESLFNTNIVVINTEALKENFNQYLKAINLADFQNAISPELIKNSKEQDGLEFIQLEGAIGSTVLNLDKYFRQNFQKPIVHFLNLSPIEREDFFIPIKKMDDFHDLLKRYNYETKSGRFILKDKL